MDKKHTLALLSGMLLLANPALGKTKEKEDVQLEAMKTPNEVTVDSPKKTSNPFPEQDKDLVNLFNTKTSEDIFAVSDEDPFMEIDPWDD